MSSIFIDLNKCCINLKSKSKKDRLNELEKIIGNKIYISAIGGFPIINKNNDFYWCNNIVNEKIIQEQIIKGLGLSGSLTFVNSSELTLDELGTLCNTYRHYWGYHWITLSMVFSGYGSDVELAFCRDSRFFMSWVEGEKIGKVFMVSSSLKEWLKFLKNKNNNDFNKNVRNALHDAYILFSKVTGYNE